MSKLIKPLLNEDGTHVKRKLVKGIEMSKEKIIRIEEDTFKAKAEDGLNTFSGYYIITDKQTIKIGISDTQNCCEQWGYLITNDNVNDFIGAELISIEKVDTALNKNKIPDDNWEEEANTMFINFNTPAGTLQFVVYNSHNGYYGHDAVLISKQLNIVTNL